MMAISVGLFGGGRAAATQQASDRTEQAEKRTEARLHDFEALVARDWDRFWRYAYRLCGNADDAEDLLSDSLIEAFQAFDRYRGEGFDRWLFRILTTNRIDMVRRAKVRRAESLDSAFTGDDGEAQTRQIADEKADPAHILVEPLLSENLQKALDGLSEEFRSVLMLCDVEQMDYQDIARLMNLPIGTVRSRIHRGRTHLRRALEKTGWQA